MVSKDMALRFELLMHRMVMNICCSKLQDGHSMCTLELRAKIIVL
jgi:hypothetical protein